MLERLLCRLLPYRDIGNGGDLYLRRFFLTPIGWPVRIFLHHIMRSDADRDLHDHPWDFTSLILTGEYVETLPGGGCRHAIAGDVLRNPAEHTHRLILDRPMWTLVLAGKRRRTWGFHTPRGFVDWRTYLGVPHSESDSPEDQ